VAAGRVVSRVSRVTVTWGPTTVEVRPVNGTYLAVRSYKAGMPMYALVVRGYDADGRLVGETGSGSSRIDCAITPNGTRVGGNRTEPERNCEPAVRWR
jgi:hypothetical protein